LNPPRIKASLPENYPVPYYNPQYIATGTETDILLYEEADVWITFVAEGAGNKNVLGFEDIKRDLSNCDNDFNDAIFFITASPNTAIQLTKINETVPISGSISSGNSGGLESNGSLAEKIARRNVNKHLINNVPNRNSISTLTKMEDKKSESGKGISTAGTLDQYVPITGPNESVAYLSTPTDLLDITNASEVLSVDYFKDSERSAVVLITKTLSEVYSHTKSICDRVGGASLENVKKVFVKGEYPASLITIKQQNQSIEYALSFSLKQITPDSIQYVNLWNISDAETGKNYLNFQLWVKTPSDVFYLAEYILDTASALNGMSVNHLYFQPPSILMKSGTYEQGKFKMEILNLHKKTTTINVSGTLRNTENTSSVAYSETVPLSGEVGQNIILQTHGVFDAGLNIQEINDPLLDAIYIADGAWIANFEEANVSGVSLGINPQDALPSNANNYWIERGFEANGNVKNYYSIHRPLKLGLNPVDLSAYNFLVFTATGAQTIEIVISRNGITDWANQARINLTLDATTKKYYLNLNQFVDGFSNILDKSDITAVTISVISSNQSWMPFDFKMNQIAFSTSGSCESNQEVLATSYSKEKYQSQGKLTVTNKNINTSISDLTSSNSIEFLPRFQIEAGAVLKAEIKNCDN
jgi:hypothetical protein